MNKRVMQAGALAGSSWNCTGNFAVPSGTHTLKWKYYKYSGSTAGSCWIDAIQWSGGVPGSGGGADWEQITCTYDPSGRRIAKDVDGEVTKYVYDGDQCIAEYDGSNNLLRKYIHGPSIDEPICMIEAAGGYAGTYYYHFDALGSVVALSDTDGDTVQVYEYDVYGQPGASDPNHPNRFMFTGREFDAETGLYYYRARYYNPSIGRFLQTDPIGYADGLNMYAYCGNDPVGCTDPTGMKLVKYWMEKLEFNADGTGAAFRFWVTIVNHEGFEVTFSPAVFSTWEEWAAYMAGDEAIRLEIVPEKGDLGWSLAGIGEDWTTATVEQRRAFWTVRGLVDLGVFSSEEIGTIEEAGVAIVSSIVRPWNHFGYVKTPHLGTDGFVRTIYWGWVMNIDGLPEADRKWAGCASAFSLMAHEMMHALDDVIGGYSGGEDNTEYEGRAIMAQNITTAVLSGWNPHHYTQAWNGRNPFRPGGVAIGPPGRRVPGSWQN